MAVDKSIKVRTNALSNAADARELKALLDAIRADQLALKASIVGIAAKLDDDATVTDTNYEALWTPTLTLTA